MISVRRLRAMIGWLGILLPWLVSILVGYIPESISATYYTNACASFMIILGSAGLLLFSYKGYELLDDILCTIAGVFGLGVCLFPCTINELTADSLVGTFQIPMEISNIIHSACAMLFFAILACVSLFLFTKSGETKTRNKKIRNVIYAICGLGMVVSFCLLPFFSVWLVETIALFFFGVSWLTKANIYSWLFKDEPNQE